ncbi:microcystin degradation protein MlrC [Saccharothrix carnea]|uniref:Microcystin degradation protein MlrC n=1 Tax=Saccharothrix carnea TaxID=1280637 RepID=A0A2P8I5Z3_SACCR|nr:microcystin degradation protein MlrC [Saccharothrix carnea]
MRVLIGGIVHESNTFAVEVMGLTGVEHFTLTSAEDVLSVFSGTNSTMGGYLDACRQHGVEIVPAPHARAEPGSTVDAGTYHLLLRGLLSAIRGAQEVDVVLLDLHGAGVVFPDRSLELDLARAVRAEVGGKVIAASMDLHANIDERLLDVVDVVVGFHEYPHVDMANRARLAADLAIRAARRELSLVSTIVRLPMQLPPTLTTSGIGKWLREAAQQAETVNGVLACSPFHGFPRADTDQATTSVVVITDGQEGLAVSKADELAHIIWEHRTEFLPELVQPHLAIETALASPAKPAVIGDAGDNPGGGAPGDSTTLLHALLEAGIKSCVATICDPEAVRVAATAGVGGEVDLAVGGKHGAYSGAPVLSRWTVRAITNGSVVYRKMRRGVRCEFGQSVRLSSGAVDVIVCTERRQVVDPEILLLHGADPDQYDIIVVKSAVHFRSGFADTARVMLTADTAGLTTRAIATLPGRKVSATRWPMRLDTVLG